MENLNSVALFTLLESLRPGSIGMWGAQSGDVRVEFDIDGKAVVPLDVAASAIEPKAVREARETLAATEGVTGQDVLARYPAPLYFVAREDLEEVEGFATRIEELKNAPVPAYDAGEIVQIHIPDFAGRPVVAGDNLTVDFDPNGSALCGINTAQTFLESFPDAIVKPLVTEEPKTEEPKTEDEDNDESKAPRSRRRS